MNPVDEILDGGDRLQIEIGLRRGNTTVWLNYGEVMLEGCRALGEKKMTDSMGNVTGVIAAMTQVAQVQV